MQHYSDILLSTPSISLHSVATSEQSVRVFGRVHTIREHGRLTFVDLWHNGERLQLVVRGEHSFRVGAWVSATGPTRPTQRGEMSLWVEQMLEHSCATEAFETQPDHGRIPPEQRMVLQPASVLDARVRGRIVQDIRRFLWNDGFEEVSTPILCRNASGAAARPFETHARALERDMYLRVAPESQLIRLMMAGMDSIFELGACFRNEGVSERHQPQFELIECYRANETVDQTMDRLEHLMQSTLRIVHTDLTTIPYGDHISDWSAFRRATVEELVAETAGCLSTDDCIAWLTTHGIEWHSSNDPLLAWCMVFEQAVEHTLIHPTFVTRWPECVSPLARGTGDGWTARFELYAVGMELANGYEQEMSQETQHNRFAQQAALLGQEDVMASDEEYLFAMGWGMPPLSGFGLGIDRWIQVVTNQTHIRNVVLMPL